MHTSIAPHPFASAQAFTRLAPTAIFLIVGMLLAACTTESSNVGGQEDRDTLNAGTAAARTDTTDCEPLETRPPEASDQDSAFPEQTRACGVTSDVNFDVVVLAEGLEHPWAVEPLPDGSFLVTERPGRMRMITAESAVGEPITGLPEVDARRQGGLLDVELDPNFNTNRTIYWSYSEPREGGNGTAVARGILSDDGSAVSNVEVIFRAMPTYDGTLHFGSRLNFDEEGLLYVTTGDRSDAPMRRHAQELDNHLGKTLRIRPDGSVPDSNPFVGEEGAEPEIFSLGHRNIQSAAMDPHGRYWIIEHGTRGGDEVNLVEAGQNYGWPRQAYGIEYSGEPIPNAAPEPGGFRQPVYYWDPVIAPSGAEWYMGDAFPEWRGSLFVGALREQRLVRLEIENQQVTGEEHLLTDRGQRIRDVREGPDGLLYVVTDQEDGELWQIKPAD